MKKEFSSRWISSIQPRKQRKYRYNAPLHVRQRLVSAHLDKALRREYKRRSFPLRTGDEVTVATGEYKKKHGKVTEVNLKKIKILVDGVVRKKVSGQEVQVPLDPSNVIITKLNLDDKKRMKFLRQKSVKESKAGHKPDDKESKKKTEAASKKEDKRVED